MSFIQIRADGWSESQNLSQLIQRVSIAVTR